MIEPKRSQTRLRGDLQLLQVCHIKADAHVDALLLKVGHKVIVRELCRGAQSSVSRTRPIEANDGDSVASAAIR